MLIYHEWCMVGWSSPALLYEGLAAHCISELSWFHQYSNCYCCCGSSNMWNSSALWFNRINKLANTRLFIFCSLPSWVFHLHNRCIYTIGRNSLLFADNGYKRKEKLFVSVISVATQLMEAGSCNSLTRINKFLWTQSVQTSLKCQVLY